MGINKQLENLIGTGMDVETINDDLVVCKGLREYKQVFRRQQSYNVGHEELQGALKIEGFTLVEQNGASKQPGFSQVWLRKDTVVNIRGWPRVSLDYTTLDPQPANQLMLVLKLLSTPEPAKGHVWAIVRGPRGLNTMSLGKIEEPLVRDNYADDALSDYDHITACLNSATPCGRISLLSGPPGTGKSFMVRAMVTDVKARFLLASHSLIGQLSGPEIYPLLADQGEGVPPPEENVKRRPTVLIIEDADDVIKAGRDSKGIYEILNLGDGLFGELADIRILLTTNAPKIALDDAITRPGRMCRHLTMDKLHRTQANKIHARLTNLKPELDTFRKPTTLAEAYRTARDDGWLPEVQESRPGHYL